VKLVYILILDDYFLIDGVCKKAVADIKPRFFVTDRRWSQKLYPFSYTIGSISSLDIASEDQRPCVLPMSSTI